MSIDKKKIPEKMQYNKDFQVQADKETIKEYLTDRVPRTALAGMGEINSETLKTEVEKTGVVQGEQNEMLFAYVQNNLEEADEQKAAKDAAIQNELPAQKSGRKDRKREAKDINELRKTTNEDADANTLREKADLDYYAEYRKGFLQRHKGYAGPLMDGITNDKRQTLQDGLLPFMHVYKRKWFGMRAVSLDGVSDPRGINKRMFRNYFNKGTISDWFAKIGYGIMNTFGKLRTLFGGNYREQSLKNNTLDKCLMMILEHNITSEMLTDKYVAKHAIEFEAHLDRLKAFQVLKQANPEWFEGQSKEIKEITKHLVDDMIAPLESFMNEHKRLHCLEKKDDQGEPGDIYRSAHDITQKESTFHEVPHNENETEEDKKQWKKDNDAAMKVHREQLDSAKATAVQTNITESWKKIHEQQIKAREVMSGLIGASMDKLLSSVEKDANKARAKRKKSVEKKGGQFDEVVFKYDVHGQLGQKVARMQDKISENSQMYHVLGSEINTIFGKFHRLANVMDELKGREVMLGKQKKLLSESKVSDGLMKSLFESQRKVEIRRNQKQQESVQSRMDAYENVIDFLTGGGEGELSKDAKAILKAEGMPYVEYFPQWKKNYEVLHRDGLGEEGGAIDEATMVDHFWKMRDVTRTQSALTEQLQAEEKDRKEKEERGELEPLNPLKIDYQKFGNYNLTDFSKFRSPEALSMYREVKCLTDFAKKFDKMSEKDKMKAFPTEEARIDAEARADCFREYGAKWVAYFERAINPKYYLPLSNLEEMTDEQLETVQNNLTAKHPKKLVGASKEDDQIQDLITEVKTQRDIFKADNKISYFSSAAYENRKRHHTDLVQWRFIRYHQNAFADKDVVDVQKAMQTRSGIEVQNQAQRVDFKAKAKNGEDKELVQEYIDQKISHFLSLDIDPSLMEIETFHMHIETFLQATMRYREMKTLMEDQDFKPYFDTYPEVRQVLEARMNNGQFQAIEKATTKYVESHGFSSDLSGLFKEKMGEKDLGLEGMSDEKRKEEWAHRFGGVFKEAKDALKDAREKTGKLTAEEQFFAKKEVFNKLYEKGKGVKGLSWDKWRPILESIGSETKWFGMVNKSKGLQSLVRSEARRMLEAGPASLNEFFSWQLEKNSAKDLKNKLTEMNFKVNDDAAAQIIETSNAVQEITNMQFMTLDMDTDTRLRSALDKQTGKNKIGVTEFKLLLREVYRQQNGFAVSQRSEEAFKQNNQDVSEYLKGNKAPFLLHAAKEVLSFELKDDMFEYENIRKNFKSLYQNALRMDAFRKLYIQEKDFFESDALSEDERNELRWRFNKLAGGAYAAYSDMLKAYVRAQGVEEDGQVNMGLADQELHDKADRDKNAGLWDKLVRFATGSMQSNRFLGDKIEDQIDKKALNDFEKAYYDAKTPFMELKAAKVLRTVNKQYAKTFTDEHIRLIAFKVGLDKNPAYANLKYVFDGVPENATVDEELEIVKKNRARMAQMFLVNGTDVERYATNSKNKDKKIDINEFSEDMSFFVPLAKEIKEDLNKMMTLEIKDENQIRDSITPELYISFKKVSAFMLLAEKHRDEWGGGQLLAKVQAFTRANNKLIKKGGKPLPPLDANGNSDIDALADMVGLAGDIMGDTFTGKMKSFARIMDLYTEYVGVNQDGTFVRDDFSEKIGESGDEDYKVALIEENRQNRAKFFHAVLDTINTEQYKTTEERYAKRLNKQEDAKAKKKDKKKKKK